MRHGHPLNSKPIAIAAAMGKEALPPVGYALHRGVFQAEEISALRAEADRVADRHGAANVRHLREASAVFDRLAKSDRLHGLLPPGWSPVRSILFDKTPDENWPVAWHQDLTIAVRQRRSVDGYGPWSVKQGVVHVQPPVALLESMVTLRIHLDDTGEDNGALRVIPGAHRRGRISVAELDEDDTVTCACAAGDVLAMSPLLPHSSPRSRRPSRRRVIHFEYAPRSALDPVLKWSEGAGGTEGSGATTNRWLGALPLSDNRSPLSSVGTQASTTRDAGRT